MMMRSLPWILVWGLTWGLAAPAPAQSPPPQEPILRIDPGMHIGMAKRAGADAGCTLLATGSDDKTVMLWRLPEGKLLRTLRPPIGPGHDGKVFAVAMSPDGSWVAAGGWDAAFQSQKTNHVYIFQTGTGAVAARIGEADGKVINHIAISHDGQRIAIARHLGQGVEVWARTGAGLSDWRIEGRDSDYGREPSYGVAFDRSGALYAVGYDGRLRRYAAPFNGRPDAIVKARAERPYSVAVHPSGNRVAIGYEDARTVDIYDAPSLRWRVSADTRDVVNGDLSSVAWSTDGNRLLAAGSFTYQSRNIIISWDKAGEGAPKGLPGPQNTVTNLVPCGDDMVFAAQDPPFGIVMPAGGYKLWPSAVQADLRGQYAEQGISVSADARRVRFGLESGGRSPVLFDLLAERVTDSPNPVPDMTGADTRSLKVTDWVHLPDPRLDGKPLALEQNERARALAIAPDGEGFVLGADWSIRGYDRGGQQVWSKASQGTLWGVNIPRDGKVVVAAHGDGTIRWHRLTDGEELLALFVHAKDRRWVAWTPRGYYMASPGAETLVGWHVNGGWNEAAQFYPVSQFREQFNRPDIVKLVLETLDEERAIGEANRRSNQTRAMEDVRQIVPPIVTIQDISPVGRATGEELTFRSPELTISYEAFSETGKEITSVEVHINKAKLRNNFVPGVRKNKHYTSGELKVSLQPRDVTITLVARDEDDRPSQPVSISLRWDGAKPGQVALPRLRALFVGNNDYPFGKLNFAVKDAEELAALFTSHKGKSYSSVDARVLKNVTRKGVIDGLKWLEQAPDDARDDDVNLLFLAGHGKSDAKNHFYYLTVDTDPNDLATTAVSKDSILSLLRNRKGAMVVMLDACHSGATAEVGRLSQVDMNRTANELGDAALEVQLYASAEARQYSLERKDWGHGAFTKAMIKALSGAADRDKRGFIEVHELGIYLREEVKEMTEGQQTPTRRISAQEMHVVRLK